MKMDMNGDEIVLRPSDIRYTQNTTSNKFSNRTLIGRLLDDIVIGRCFVSDVKRIEVKLVDGLWYCADSRRLWVFKQLEFLGYCPLVTVKVIKHINWDKCTSANGGTSVSIRGQPGGIWFSKAEQIRQKLKRDVSVSEEQNENIELAKSKLCSSNFFFSDDLQSIKCPIFKPNAFQDVRCGNSTKLLVDCVKQYEPNKNQVTTLKKKRKDKNAKVTAKTVKILDVPSEVSRNDTHETVNNSSDYMLLMKKDNEMNGNPNMNTRKKRQKRRLNQKKET